MPEQETIAAARESVDAFTASDWARFRAALTPDSIYDEKGTGRRLEGVDAIVEVSQRWKQAFPDARGTITQAIASGDTVVLEITWEGTQTGALATPAGEIPPTGMRVAVPAVQVLTIAGGKVKENRHYIDVMGMLQQLGVTPGPAPAIG